MRRRGNHGQVVIIGGAEDREGEAGILREFVRLAGGARARISIIAAASENASEVAASYVEVFRRLGGRLLTAVAHYPQDLGLGIDENTALVVNKNEFEVIGEGAVTVIDAGTMSYTNLPYAEECRGLALYGVSVHVLPAGYRFDLAERAPIVPGDGEAQKKDRGSNSDSAGKQAKRTKGRK